MAGMQMTLDLGVGAEVARLRDRLAATDTAWAPVPVREPTGQLVKSMLSSRTKDAVSLAAYERLIAAYPDWSALAEAAAADVESLIAEVTFPEKKTPEILDALRRIRAERHGFDLSFLGRLPVEAALAWLERLKGVGRKISASTLNFSTLCRPAFVVDTHVLRVLRRLGLVALGADIFRVYEAVMEATPGWSALDYREFHILLKRHGQNFCQHDRMACPPCPLRDLCRSAG